MPSGEAGSSKRQNLSEIISAHVRDVSQNSSSEANSE